jgi:hypothetical protein
VIVCSLNEVEIYGRRAARGGGMPWGLAEEAGKASRWLAERGLPGVELLVQLLGANDGRSYASMAPVIANGRWQALDGELCPVCSGVALSDHIDLLTSGKEISLIGLAYPLLLAPFLDRSWRHDEACYEIRGSNACLSVFEDGVTIKCEQKSAHLSEYVEEVKVTAAKHRNAHPAHRPRTAGVKTPLSVWRVMEALAKRTYVPATEESRARGAGAGRTDND